MGRARTGELQEHAAATLWRVGWGFVFGVAGGTVVGAVAGYSALIYRLVDPTLSGLPAFLTRVGGLNSGFMIAQVTAAAVASELKAAGVVTYEQDWLNQRALPRTDNLTDQDAFLDNMAASMAQRNLTMQYCMASARHFMQSSKYSNLTTIRTSADRLRCLRDRTRQGGGRRRCDGGCRDRRGGGRIR